MRFGLLVAVAAAILGIASAPAQARDWSATVDTASYFDVSALRPGQPRVGLHAAPTPDGTTIHSAIAKLSPSSTKSVGIAQNFPFPTCSAQRYVDDNGASFPDVSVGDTQITITNN